MSAGKEIHIHDLNVTQLNQLSQQLEQVYDSLNARCNLGVFLTVNTKLQPAGRRCGARVILILGAGRIVGADQNTVWILGADHTVHEFSKRSHGLGSTRGKLY